ncbi:hypothetical protein BX666DRAFT_1981596 [Dichotomocladium elegans]|nr:hypothetical protein BX666DRAFT_1981596 [Dichotomocladium elegans]
MNEATITPRSRKPRQYRSPRPRSGSWGDQELAYYKNFENSSPSYPSKFLSMSSASNRRGLSKSPSLLPETIQPEQLFSTPVQVGVPNTKKRSMRIGSISQFFRSLSSKPTTTSQIYRTNYHREETTPPPVPPPKDYSPCIIRPADGGQEQTVTQSNVEELISNLPQPDIHKRLPKCPTFHGSPAISGSIKRHQRRPPLLRHKTSEDNSITQQKRNENNSAVVSSQTFESDISDEDGGLDESIQLNISQAHDSQIAGDYLSKRLSGGHFGSAGGLIISTTPMTTPSSMRDDRDIKKTLCDSLLMVTTPPPADPPSPTATEDYEDLGKSQCQQGNEEEQAAEIAKRIWEDDPTVYHNLEHIVEWMGDGKPLSMLILKHYFGYFDFTNQRLDEAFRKFCSKLHLKAETQQIDRVLGEFAHRYWDCNPFTIFAKPDVVHAIVYSLVLLNTDLHVAQGDHRKMSQNAFIRNTINAVQAHLDENSCDAPVAIDVQRNRTSFFLSSIRLDEDEQVSSSSTVKGSPSLGSREWMLEVEALLRDMYTSIRHRQIADPFSSKADEAGASSFNNRRRSLQITAGRVGALKRSVGTIMWKSTSTSSRESMMIAEVVEPEESDVATSPFHRRRSMSSLKSSASQTSHLAQTKLSAHSVPVPNPSTAAQEQPNSLLSEMLPPTASGVPYYKEGVIARKHLLERAGQKARHRDWKECFMVADRGEVRMYKLENDHRKSIMLPRNSIMLGRNYGTAEGLPSTDCQMMMGGGCLSHAEIIGTIDLKHTLANSLPSGYNRHRPHAFALQQSNGGVYLFQVGSAEEAVGWVDTCNYWAARGSKEPLMGSVSNIEYGWGNGLDDNDNDDNHDHAIPATVIVHEWHPPIPPTAQSTLDEHAQLSSLHKHVQALNEALDQHRDL